MSAPPDYGPQQGYKPQGGPDYSQQYYQNGPQDPFQQNQQYNQQPQQDLEHQQNNYSEKPVESNNFDESFKIEKPRFNDWYFGVFFLCVVAGFGVIAGITIKAYVQTHSFQGSSIYDANDTFTLNSNAIILFAFIIAVGLVGSFLIILFARIWPKQFIIAGLVLNIILGLATAVYYLVMKYWSAGIVFLVFTLFSAWCFWSCRSRIPFSATVLTIVIDVMKRYPSTLLVSFIGLVCSAAFSALFSVVIVATYIKYDPSANNPGCNVSGGGCSQSKLIGILVFVFFAGFYISEVFKNIVHVVIAGVYGTWYYLDGSDQGAPRFPALGALKRALTYCFGSICFGSLLVAILQLIRQAIVIAKNNAFASGDNCAGCCLLILNMLMGFIEWAVRYFNQYAYCYVALYGKSYIRSARDTFDLMKRKGMDALINDSIIGTSINFFAVFVGYLTALLTWLYLKYTAPEYNSGGSYTAPLIAFSFLISMQISRVSLTVIDSGVSTFFVALAKDPEVFQMTNRDKFDEIFRNYPQVLNKLNSDN